MSTIQEAAGNGPAPKHSEPEQHHARGKRWLWLFGLLAVGVGLAFIPGGVKDHAEVAAEFELHPVIEIPALGPVDFSITKPVIYLWISVAVVAILAFAVNRTLRLVPGRFQLALEALYDLARNGIAGVMKTGRDAWFPYIASAFVFVLVNNVVGLIPLPFGENYQFAFYAATANINVTAMLALCTFVFTHYAGVRQKGGAAYIRGWSPSGAPPVLKQLIFGIHTISELFRLVSLSVRLFANMLAGHAVLAVFFAMALVFQNYLVATALQGFSLVIYLFEIFVAFIQAFIFAILSAVYIGGALEEGH